MEVSMMDSEKPDLKAGISLDQLADGGMVLGTVDGEEVIVVRRQDEFFAVGAHCTHYHGPLAQGLIVDETVRCPWHHACFSLRTGEAVRAPALDPLPSWRAERVGNRLFVRGKSVATEKQKVPKARGMAATPAAVVIIGGGAAGLAAADMLRREGYAGALTLISADDSPPCDRPNLSKDYLAGTAQEDWVALRPPEYYTERDIDLVLNTRVKAIDVQNKLVGLGDGRSYRFDALLIA